MTKLFEARHLKLSYIFYISVKPTSMKKSTEHDNICNFVSPVLSAFRILMLYFITCSYVKFLVYKHDETLRVFSSRLSPFHKSWYKNCLYTFDVK